MASVSLERVRKSFGKLPVIHGVDLAIDDGEFVVLVGPSGCGKSTLLRMIAGLEETTSGEIHIGRRVVNALSPKERNVAMVFQSYALYPHMTVSDNISLSLRLSRIGKDAVRQKVDWAADTLNLDGLLDRLPSQLSGGQRQRVAMGRAIVRNPDLFLFDEPLSNLDAKLRVQMRTEIRELHQDLKATTIYVTHDQIEAMTMADRIVVMDHGHVLQAGTPFEIYDQPVDLTVAGFIGSPSMNLLRSATSNDRGGLVIDGASAIPGDRLDTAFAGRPAGSEFILGVRPEDFDVVDKASGIPARVKVVEPTGPDTIVMAETQNFELSLLVRERTTLMVGDEIGLAVRPGKAHIFDIETQNRLGTV